MKRLVFTLLLALVLWTVMFSPWTAPHVPFWWTMAGSALTLCILSTCFNPGWWRQVRWSPSNILLGVLIAVGLWLVFWTGDKVSAWLFDFARPQVDAIYGMKSGWSPFLARLRATHPFPALGCQCGLCGLHPLLRPGSCGVVQLHARDGGVGGRRGVGRALSLLP